MFLIFITLVATFLSILSTSSLTDLCWVVVETGLLLVEATLEIF